MTTPRDPMNHAKAAHVMIRKNQAAGDVEVTGTKDDDDSEIFCGTPRQHGARSVHMLLLAQALGEYSGLGSNAPLGGSQALGSGLWDRVRGVDQQTWVMIGGVVIIVMLLSLRSKRR
jgi:hypothetical protein